ncbi:zinc finger and SCAN domain-containing protein 9-like [Pseudomyrmex gracilis]|uniref:zinc finger and SCAN domain-containing protein 9-like n=1 Tax=Pseudomyrmex gracilis TaxID=219809 RepID=UPI000995040D|nr:zinc finger and SCAN domain-containing protein 9-like [Pseudomyrmex gracilis]
MTSVSELRSDVPAMDKQSHNQMMSRRSQQQQQQQQQPQQRQHRLRKAVETAMVSSIRHQCPKCEKSFSQSYSMYRHYKYECDSLPRYQCPYCGHVSKWSHSIYNHIRKLHPGQQVTTLGLSFWRSIPRETPGTCSNFRPP